MLSRGPILYSLRPQRPTIETVLCYRESRANTFVDEYDASMIQFLYDRIDVGHLYFRMCLIMTTAVDDNHMMIIIIDEENSDRKHVYLSLHPFYR
jgi:hypothetical protein